MHGLRINIVSRDRHHFGQNMHFGDIFRHNNSTTQAMKYVYYRNNKQTLSTLLRDINLFYWARKRDAMTYICHISDH